jgi:hypothetical protein
MGSVATKSSTVPRGILMVISREPGLLPCSTYPSRRLLSARVSAFLDHLKEAFPMGTPDELAAYISG